MVNDGHKRRACIRTTYAYLIYIVANFVFSQWDQSEDHRPQQQQEGQRKKPLSGLAWEDAMNSFWNAICQSINLNRIHSWQSYNLLRSWNILVLALYTSES